MFEQSNAQGITSDVREVFEWSAPEILAAPESPIVLPGVCERCVIKTTHGQYQVM